MGGLPADAEAFCRAVRPYGWRAACVTLGARGCALFAGDNFVEAPGVQAAVVDTVGAGDAFAAAFVHGLASGWPAETIADFANRTGAAVAAGPGRHSGPMKNQAQLIAYVDRCSGGAFRDLQRLLEGPLREAFGGVHLLPFFHPIDGADAGFDPIDHTAVDPRLGSWDDVRELASRTEIMADMIVNHISRRSPQFADFDARGDASPYASLFLTFSRVFPRGASGADLLALHAIRPGLPFTRHRTAHGERVLLWTTFTCAQVDIDIRAPGRPAVSRRHPRAASRTPVSPCCGSTPQATPARRRAPAAF